MRNNLPIDETELWNDLMVLATITEPERPWTRRAFSTVFLEGRAFVAGRMREAGLTVRLDAAGNMIGRREGRFSEHKAIVIGSHSDTVPDGGRFDGTAGVMAGIAVARSFQRDGTELDHPFEVIDCLAEEVSIFGLSCIGSRAICGKLKADQLDRAAPESGEILRDAIDRMGGDAAYLDEAQRGDIAAYLEMHIEQGPVLEDERLDIGIVTAIAGITRLEIVIEGRADHAGTTPMHVRQDALAGAAAAVSVIAKDARRRAKAGHGHFVATVGEFRVEPNAANVVPNRVTLLVDTRAEERSFMEGFVAELQPLILRAMSGTGARITEFRAISDNRPALSDPLLLDVLEQSTEALGLGPRRMASGAGHDMAWFSRVAPSAMIFIPSKDGRSHTPEEWSEPGEIAAGAAVLHETVLRLDKMLA
ncbi:Zn-dependent hydrolase [Kaistia terrae]|jgi:N-carbamoyl-L-amino-acid hydrolase|uniref:Zn-dependent hydrolase n=1 Tax=Kaistia terrae TaxID=537017 RepID=A0ABW0PW85_9HYPH|nr:Zn-dependent hydrolase [Kaistia terrae]MCX5581638.1 Zn-dependent hydrolase [Kaistia terrae]